MSKKKAKAHVADAPAAGREASAEDQLLRAGREAADAYDYDLARAHFSAAFAAHGSEASALALLQLFVEQLAADDDALALGERLSAVASKHPEIRTLLALSAARCGKRERALRLVKDQDGARTAEVFVALARVALAASDLAQAGRDLAEARRRDPAHAEILALADAIAARRADERTPLEAALARLVAEGRLEEAGACAGSILARWPESEAARRVVRAAEEQKKAQHASTLLSEAEQALERGEAAVALAAARQALATGGLRGDDAERARRRIAEIEAIERAQEECAAAGETARLLREADLLPAFLSYLALDAGARGRVRAQVPLASLAALDETGAQGTGAKPRAAALAIQALQRAGEVVAREPGAALDLLAPHDAVLRAVAPARALAGEARRLLAERRREAARGALAEARAALAAGAPERANELVTEQVLRDLPDAERGAAEDLRARARDAAETERRAAEVERLRQRGALLAARDEATALAARSSAADHARWTQTHAAIQAEIQRAFRVHVFAEPEPFATLRAAGSHAARHGARPLRTLVPGTSDLVLLQAYGPWIFLRVVDLDARVVRTRVVVRTPEAFASVDAEVHAGRVVITGKPGCLLSLTLDRWEVETWYAMPETRDRRRAHVDDVVPVAGARYLWVNAGVDGTQRVYIVDVARARVLREIEIEKGIALRALPGPGEPRVVFHRQNARALPLHDARGALIERYESPLRAMADGIAALPGGPWLFLLAASHYSSGPDDPATYGWTVVARDTAPRPLTPLAGLDDLCPVGVAVDHGARRLFVRMTTAGDDALLGLGAPSAADPAALEPLFHVAVPPRTRLVQDPESGRTLALCPEAAGVRVVPLGAGAPDVPTGLAPRPFAFPCLTGIRCGCHVIPSRDDRAHSALLRAVSDDPKRLPHRTKAVRAEDDPRRMLEWARILDVCTWEGEANKLVQTACERHPDHPVIRLHKAAKLAMRGQWRHVLHLLTGVDTTALDACRAMHAHHLRASALLMTGAPDQAREELAAATVHPGKCQIDALRGLVCTPDALGPDGLAVHRLVAAVREADACLLRDDARGALDLLEGADVWACEEVQSLARLAEAFLRLPDEHPFHKAEALAMLADAHDEAFVFHRRDLPIPGASWDKTRLDALAEKARAWLDAAFPGAVT